MILTFKKTNITINYKFITLIDLKTGKIEVKYVNNQNK